MTPAVNQKWRCKSCNGTYRDQPGGYYHKCPPGTKSPRDENIDDSKPKDPTTNKHPVKKKGKGKVQA